MYCCNINVMGSPPPPISGRRLQMKQLAQAAEVRDRDEASTQPQQQETPKRYFNILYTTFEQNNTLCSRTRDSIAFLNGHYGQF